MARSYRCRINTGVSGAAALISSSVGSRFSANWCSVKPPTIRTQCDVLSVQRGSDGFQVQTDATPDPLEAQELS